ncbi:MAG: hypothetical protein QG560_1113, partial [Campylobacterota bacterium]|nr:hypothetical protein [Campylobacterota bacterium]
KIEVRKLMEKLKINDLSFLLNQTYIDYPAGTMFWFRPNAITQILDANFKYSDFPPEPIANDGTIAHALERLFGYVARLNGYHFYEVNYSRGLFTKDFCHKNFNQLEAKTLNTAKDMVSLNDCVLFDIFDTLITRTLYAPDNLFRLMEFKIDKKFGVKSNFFELRKSVEGILRAKLPEGRDVCYGEIYDGMHINCRLDLKLIAFAKDLEFELELKVTRAKNEVVELLNFAKDSGKKLILVSDMYLEQAQISSLLEKAGINIDGILLKISSQTGLRKDNAKIWKNLCETNFIDPTKAIAIGDNEVSDAKIPGDFGIKSFHLLSEKNLFLESNIGKSFFERFKSVSDANMIIFGPIVKHLFNSPFYKSDTVINFSKKFTPYEFGLVAMAPFLYVWMSYIYAKHKNNKIFFLSRDGYFLKEIFEHFLETKNLELKQEAKYLLVSRRAVMGAHKKDENSLKNMIYDLGDFNGKFSELIHNRMGLNTDFLDKASTKDFSIKTKDDMDKAYTILVKNIDIVNLYAQDERKNYMRYLEKSGFFDNDLNVLIDLGYSGTIQNYMHKLTDKKMIGEYLVTTKKVKDLESQENEMIGFFGDKVEGYYDNMIFKYSLILEAYFTSDEGQLINFDNTISPVFKDYSGSICIQKEITEGIKDYISELGMVDYDFLANNSQVKDMSIFMFEYIINKRLMDENLRKIFFIEDDFTGKGSLDILNLLYQRGI